MRDFCYFVQSARLRRARLPDVRLSDAVEFDYMGMAEFEFGTLPAANRRLHAAAGDLRLSVVDGVLNADGAPLVLLHPASIDPAAYGAAVQERMANRGRTMSYAGLDKQAQAEPPFIPRRCRTKAQKAEHVEEWRRDRQAFWWDLGNDVMFSFDAALMRDLPGHLQASWESMNLTPADLSHLLPEPENAPAP